MPKLNKIRLTRIRYNNNLTGIDDAVLDLDGVSTLLKLANGGGKTVLIQMLLAPYVSARHRNFKGRPFSDYFKDPQPSFIVEEWIKDNRTGKFLVGLMVRKSQHTAEDNDTIDDRKLDLYGFVAEYSESCAYDIEQLALVQKDLKAFLPFTAAKEYLETLSKTYPSAFRLYNLSNYATEKKFREKLVELNLDRSEWDQLWEFNQDESGLSSLCEKYNTDQKLVRDVFVPAVEQKLDQMASEERDFSQMTIFRNDLRGIAQMQLRNIENLENQQELERLLERLHDTLPLADQLIGHQKGVQAQTDQFASLVAGLQNEENRLNDLAADRKRLQEEGELELKHIRYETLSQRYYGRTDELEQVKTQKAQTQAEADALSTTIQDREQALERYVILENQEKIDEARKEKAHYQGKIDSAKMSEQAVMEEAAGLGSALYQIVSQRWLEGQRDLKQRQSAIANLQKQGQDLETMNKARQTDLQRMFQNEGALHMVLKKYEAYEKDAAQQLDTAINHTMAMYEDEAIMKEIVEQKRAENEKAEMEGKLAQEQHAKKEQELEACVSRLAGDNEEKVRLENRMQATQMRLEEDERILEKRRFFIRMLGLSGSADENLWDLGKIGEQFDYRIRLTQENIDLASEMLARLKRELENLRTGCSLRLSEPIRNVLEDLGILEMYGSEWLKSSAGSEAYRKRVLENHPFLPYALVMTDKEIERFLSRLKEEKLFTSEPIPILSRNVLNQKAKHPDLSDQGLYFYLSFNEALIDPDTLKTMIAKKEGQIRSEQTYQRNQYDALEDLQKNKTLFLQEKLDKKEYGAHIREKQAAEEKMNRLLSRIHRTKQNELELRKSLQHLRQEIDRLSILEARAQRQHEIARELFGRFMEAAQTHQTREALKAEMNTLQAQISESEREIKRVEQTLQEQRQTTQALRYRLKEVEQEKDRFGVYEEAAPAQGDETTLRGRFEALQKKLQDSQVDYFEEQLAKTVKKLNELELKHARLEKEFIDRFHVEIGNLDGMVYSLQTVVELKREINTARNRYKAVNNDLRELDGHEGRIIGENNSVIRQIQELNGMDHPLEKARTRLIDLTPEKKRVEDLIRDAKNEAEAANKRIIFCQSLKGKGQNALKTMPAIEEANVPDLSLLEHVALQERFELELQNLNTLKAHVTTWQTKIEKHLTETMASLSGNRSDLLAMLAGMKETVTDGELFKKDLEVKASICQSMVDKLEGELEKLKKNTALFNENVLEHVRKMNEQIKKIERSTTITLNDRRRQMLQVDMPDWGTMENVYKLQVEQFTTSMLEDIVQNPNDMERIIQQRISAKELLGEVIGFQKIRLRLYKVEQGRESRISWSQANKTSGAEGFICAFVVVSALLAYRRRDEEVLPGRQRNQGSVLLMDNPFAKVQSKHIVDALMNLCRATNTQLIAFSDVENAAIINSFDNIYTLRKKRRIDGKDTLEIERVKEPEEKIEGVHIRVQQQPLF